MKKATGCIVACILIVVGVSTCFQSVEAVNYELVTSDSNETDEKEVD